MEDLRKNLQIHEISQSQMERALKEQQRMALIDKLAGKRHHLLGTISNPGIYTTRPKTPTHPLSPKLNKDAPPALIKIPESQLRDNLVLKEWIDQNLKNSKNFFKKVGVRQEPEPETVDKTAQGPFLVFFSWQAHIIKPKYALIKKKFKPFKPTLRVQTDYYDTPNFKREEKRQELTQRCKICSQLTFQ